MGKTQKKKSMRRHNPVRVPDNHLPAGLAAASASSSKNQAVLPIIQKMESADATERKWACAAVSNIIQNDPSTRRLLQGKNVVGALITRLSDNEEEVVVEAAGALRNLCIDGGYDICGEMFNKNILAPTKTSIPKISATLQQYLENPKSAPDNAKKLIYEFSENIITILWCLSETSHKALTAINDMNLVPFLMAFLTYRAKLAMSPVTAAAQCLYVLTDDNIPAIREIKFGTEYVTTLMKIAKEPLSSGEEATGQDSRAVMLRVLAVGVLRNIQPLPSSNPASQTDLEGELLLPLLQPVIGSINLVNTAAAVQEYLTKDSSMPSVEKLPMKDAPKDHKSPAEVELENIEMKLRTIQLSLEILTGVCATIPDAEVQEPEVEEEEAEGDDEMVAEDVDDTDDADETDAEDNQEDDEAMIDDKTTANGIPSGDVTFSALSPLLDPLLHLIQPTSLSFPPTGGASPHPPTTSALSAIHVCAFECLNNLFLGLAAAQKPAISANAQAGTAVWNQVWAALKAIGTVDGPGQERRKDAWDIGAGVLWGIASVWKGSLVPQEDEVKLIMDLCDNAKDDVLRVKCIGALECLAQRPEAVDANRVIATYLLQALPTASAPSPVGTEALVQVVSALIDIYSNEELPYDINFRSGNFLARLTDAVDGVKKAVKGIDRKKPGGQELKARGEETRDNLVAFVKYRRKLKL